MALRIDVMRISPARGEPLSLPSYATDGSAGVDLRADANVTLAPGERALVPTGIAVAIPRGFEGQVRPRSGLALRDGDRIAQLVIARVARAELVESASLPPTGRGEGGFGHTGRG